MRSTTTRAAGTALVLAAGLALGACGGDDGGGALDRAAVGKQLDAICKTANTDAAKIEAPADLGDPKVAAAYFGKVQPVTQKETDAIVALEGDDGVKADLDAVKSAQAAANDLLKTITEKAKNADSSGLKDLEGVVPAGQKFAAAAKKAGATSCG